MNRLAAAVLALGLMHPLALPAQSTASDGVELVSSLYRAFAWETIAGGELGNASGFIDQPKRELERYLEPSLARLILDDRACVERTQEICRIDFMPLWNSQDPMPSDLRVSHGDDAATVLVQFRPSSVDDEVTVRYELVTTPAGPRISNIVYAEDWSLRTALEAE